MNDKAIRILLIEDNPGDVQFVRQALADTRLTGFTIPAFDLTCARRLSSGLRRLAPGKFDALLLDLSLPDSEGLDALAKAHARAPQTPIIILSDREDERLALEAVQKGAQDYLAKGEISGSLLVRAIRYAIERNRLEAALWEREALLRESQAIAHIGSWELDVVANRLTWSDEVYRIFGLQPQEFGATYEAFLDTVHPDDRAAVDAAYSGSLREGRDTYEIEHRIIRRDNGEVRVVHEKCRHVKDGAGRIVRSVGMVQDITERKRVEEALKRERDLVERIMETSPAGIVTVNREGQITFANARAEQVLGLTHEEIGARTYNDPRWRISDYAGNPFPDEELPFRRVMATGQPVFNVRHAIEWPDGRRVLLSINGAPIFDTAGRVDGMVATVEDVTVQVQAEEALRESEARYRAVIESQVDLISRYLPDTTLTFVNDAYCKFYGKTREELIGHSYLSMIAPEFREQVRRETEELAKAPRPLVGDYLNYRYDGKECWIQWVVQCIRDENGQVVELQAVGRDVTERKQAEGALRQESQFSDAVIKNAAEGLCVCHAIPEYPYVAFTVWNDRMTELTGYTMEEINRLGWYQMMYPDPEVQKRAVERMARMRQGEDLHAEEWVVTRADGEQRTLLISTSIVEGGDGGPHVLAVMQDVTKRVQAEKERERLLIQVQEQAQRVQQIMDTVPEGVLLLDSDCRVVLANPLGKRDLAALADAQVGDVLVRLGERSIEELLTSPPRGLWHELTTDNRFFQVLARPIEEGSTSKGWALVIRDVTQQREAERRAQQQERLAAVGQLAAGIAHDFNNIMAVITLYAGMSAQTPDLPAKMYERLQTINEQARRATTLIQQILDFSRRAVLERRPMDLLPFMKEQAKLLERTLPESIKIELVYGKDEYTVKGDPTRLQQAMMNLAANARDAMPEGGHLRITLERVRLQDAKRAPLPDMSAGDWVTVSVSDTGVGIPPDVLPHIFEPFFTTKAVGEGTGLGLAQVYGIVKQHEGYIDLKTRVGEGTTLTLYLPALAVPPPEPSPLWIEQSPRGHGETILVVEDNAAARQAIVSSLEMLGYRTLEAANGEEALALYMQHGSVIALVVSDVVMPEMSGRALLHTLKERDPAVRVVLLTGHPFEKEEFENLRAKGLRGWVLKPLSVEQLAEVVARALE